MTEVTITYNSETGQIIRSQPSRYAAVDENHPQLQTDIDNPGQIHELYTVDVSGDEPVLTYQDHYQPPAEKYRNAKSNNNPTEMVDTLYEIVTGETPPEPDTASNSPR